MTEVLFPFETPGNRRLSVDRPRYWKLVSDTLAQVFHAAPEIESAERYRTQIEEESPPGERLALYHASPLQVAADLAGVVDRAITDEEVRRYLELERASLDRG